MATIRCREDNGDRIEVTDEGWDGVRFGLSGSSVWATRDEAVRFAREILALARGGAAPEEVRAGDYVEITTYRHYDSTFVGSRGRLTRIDADDVPYLVETPDQGDVWACKVRKIADPEPTAVTASTFPDHIEHAKRLLAGTDHTGADIITLARELHEKA
ncbi:hypothetical protein [Streptomyces sennicomposti]